MISPGNASLKLTAEGAASRRMNECHLGISWPINRAEAHETKRPFRQPSRLSPALMRPKTSINIAVCRPAAD